MSNLLQNTLNETLAGLPANGIAELADLIDPDWIEQALEHTGRASIRRRKLPAQHAVWRGPSAKDDAATSPALTLPGVE